MIHARFSSASISWILSPALVSAIGCAGSLHAQRVGSVGLRGAERRVPPATELGLGVSTAPEAGGNTRAIRLLTAAGGTVVGFFVGATVGYQVLSHDCGGCDDPGLHAIMYGALVGIPVGAALGAAAPRLGSVCRFGERTGRALLGAFAGGAVGLVAGVATEGAALITIPAFSIAGALGSLGRCSKVEPQ